MYKTDYIVWRIYKLYTLLFSLLLLFVVMVSLDKSFFELSNSEVSSEIYSRDCQVFDLDFSSSISLQSVEYPDDDDSTSWNNADIISSTPSSYVFSSRNDYDYYVYSPQHSRCVYILLDNFSNETDVIIDLYKNSTTNLVASYRNSTNKTYNNFADKLVYVEPTNILYIKVRPISNSTVYSIKVEENPNLSGISTISQSRNIDRYYWGNSIIKFKMNSNMNSIIYGSTHSYSVAFQEAISLWNKVGNNVQLCVVNDNANIEVRTDSLESIRDQSSNTSAIAYTQYSFASYFDWPRFKTEFHATSISVVNDISPFNQYIIDDSQQNNISDGYYNYVLQLFIHEIGHCLGLDHYEDGFYYNIMYKTNMCYMQFGDGDIASYLSIWG